MGKKKRRELAKKVPLILLEKDKIWTNKKKQAVNIILSLLYYGILVFFKIL